MVVLLDHASEFEWGALVRSWLVFVLEVSEFVSYLLDLLVIVVLVNLSILVEKLMGTNTCLHLKVSDLLASQESSDV